MKKLLTSNYYHFQWTILLKLIEFLKSFKNIEFLAEIGAKVEIFVIVQG